MGRRVIRIARKVYKRVTQIFLREDFEYAELQGCLLAIVWGCWMFGPYYDPISDPVRSPTYQSLLQVAPHEAWGALFLALGISQVYGLIYRNYAVRRTASLAAVMSWAFVAIFIGLQDWKIFSVPLYAMFSLGAAWGYIRLGMTSRVPR